MENKYSKTFSNIGKFERDRNIYLYKDASASVKNAEIIGLKLYPNPVKNIANFSANETIQNVF